MFFKKSKDKNFSICKLCKYGIERSNCNDCHESLPFYPSNFTQSSILHCPSNFVASPIPKKLSLEKVEDLLKSNRIAIRVDLENALYLNSLLKLGVYNVPQYFKGSSYNFIYVAYNNNLKKYFMFQRTEFDGEYVTKYMPYSFLEDYAVDN